VERWDSTLSYDPQQTEALGRRFGDVGRQVHWVARVVDADVRTLNLRCQRVLGVDALLCLNRTELNSRRSISRTAASHEPFDLLIKIAIHNYDRIAELV
jgi:hypothetical protein